MREPLLRENLEFIYLFILGFCKRLCVKEKIKFVNTHGEECFFLFNFSLAKVPKVQKRQCKALYQTKFFQLILCT